MMPIGLETSHLDLARQFVRYTDRHVFLTGKAGTGKTSFLHGIRKDVDKRLVVLAPTGVAAIHAGGVTIHSFFQLAPSLFLPETPHEWGREGLPVTTPHTILRNIRYSVQKKELMEDLELIIIDEVSMLRADMLDAIDTILRMVRRRQHQPFGGVQMLFIGDLFQLPPVVKAEDWELLKHHYESPFFFDARVLRQAPPLIIELKKIFRQDDPEFIRILNSIRNNETQTEDLTTLNQYYQPGHVVEDAQITLTTHNAKADLMNHRALAALPGALIHFDAEVVGDFPEKSFPAESRLSLKVGARIMFIRNDKGESRRFFNGKLATVLRIEDEKRIIVRLDGDKHGEMEVEPETWKNIRYRYDKLKESIDEEELGSFRQLPIRLAWAITIHKSQGLSFERAVIDAGDSFSPGQVYVALSRLTALSGLILRSRIHAGSIQTDPRVLAFSRNELSIETLIETLAYEKAGFIRKTILQAFDFQMILRLLSGLHLQQGSMFSNGEDEEPSWLKEAMDSFREMQTTSEKFSVQLNELLDADEVNGYANLVERCASALTYFRSQLGKWQERLASEIRFYRLQSRQKKPVSLLRSLESKFEWKIRLMEQTLVLGRGLSEGRSPDQLIDLIERDREEPVGQGMVEEPQPAMKKSAKHKVSKEPSSRISLDLYLAGHDAKEIAEIRSITMTTVYGHLIPFIATGEVELHRLVDTAKADRIREVAAGFVEVRFKPIKDALGDGFSYDEIRAALAFRNGSPSE